MNTRKEKVIFFFISRRIFPSMLSTNKVIMKKEHYLRLFLGLFYYICGFLEQSIKKKDSLIKTYKNMSEIKQNLNKILINPTETNIKLKSELEYYHFDHNNLLLYHDD